MLKFLFDSDIWQEIYGGIRKNKVRTGITMIGVMWGIFLLVVLLGATRGIENNFNKLFGDSATSSIALWALATDKPFKGFQKGRFIKFKLRDVDILKSEFHNELAYVAPRCQTFGLIVNGLKSGSFTVSGDYPALDKIQKKKIIYGRFLNQNDINQKSKVTVIEKKVYQQLFLKDENPVDKYILINGINYKVIGVYKSGTIDFDGAAAYIPFTTFQQVYNRGNTIDWMLLTVNDNIDINAFEEKIKLTIKALHKVSPDDKKAIGSFNLSKIIKKIKGFIIGIQFLTWFVGVATLIAGVFAIGNILLITVKERTKEIGIRRAIGATPSNIRNQVVLESIFLTTIAGMIGIIFGGLALYFLDTKFGSGSNDPVFVNPTVNIPIVLAAFLILVVFGTLIGLLPAYVATKMRPIEALREE